MDINDVTVEQNGTMPLATLMKQKEQELSDIEIGKKVRISWFKYQEYVAENTPLWQQEGDELREKRKAKKISQKELSEHVGVCPQTLAKLEKGEPVRSRKMMKQSYETSCELITLKREQTLNSIEN